MEKGDKCGKNMEKGDKWDKNVEKRVINVIKNMEKRG